MGDGDDNNPFANISDADFTFASANKPALMRRSTMALSQSTRAGGFNRMSMNLKNQRLSQAIKMAIKDVMEEIEMSKEDVTAQAREHISDNDLILTYHTSTTLTSFFIEAKESSNFEVIVCETAPKFTGH